MVDIFHEDCRQLKRLKYSILFVVAILISAFYYRTAVEAKAAASGTQVQVNVNYAEDTAVITAGVGGSTRFYISMNKGKSWEGIDSNIIDISAFMKTKEVQLYIKGNKDSNPVIVTLMAEPNDLKVSYELVNGVGRITFIPPAGTTVEYRKGSYGDWKEAYTNMPTALYEIKGSKFYFRTAATSSRRCSKIVSVRIPKRPSSSSVKVDGSRLLVKGLRPGVTQYRFSTSSDWITFSSLKSKDKTLSLYDLLANKVVSNSPLPAGEIEFRNLPTTKKPASAAVLLEIPQQLVCPETVVVTGSTIKITDSTKKRNYEYTRVERSAVFDIAKTKWSSLSSNKEVVIKKVAVGDRVLVRIKSSVDAATKQVIPASTYKEFVITSISN